MKIIFSRKGFDSSYGGCPSPIINGLPYSLPIPTKMPTSKSYRDLNLLQCELVSTLTKGGIKPEDCCHLDPDIDFSALPRAEGWRGALGQVGASASHLENQKVGKGDLFLFFGLFRHLSDTKKPAFIGPPEYRIFGWLQIDEIIQLGSDGSWILKNYPWLKDHPHARPGWNNTSKNVLYIAAQELNIKNIVMKKSGYGLFSKGHRLTANKPRKTIWSMPDWLNPHLGGVGMTYHSPDKWDQNGILQSASRGQEFVADIGCRSDALDWLKQLLERD